MNNIKIELMFDGTNYHGFQKQNNALTVQECIETAIKKVCKEAAGITGCSRTDAGVHASMYVANFLSDTKIPLSKLPVALNTALGDDIRIIKAEYAAADFNARKHALQKTYKYTIINRKYNNVFLKNFAWFYPAKLNCDEIKKAAKYFHGSHDFSAFMAAGSSAKTFVRNIKALKVAEKNGIIEINITADGFLYNMVRIITGTLVYAGNGKISAEDIPGIIRSGDRTKAGITAPPQGLMLIDVKY
jgi:tRNA pseudouridine38-40 synthase